MNELKNRGIEDILIACVDGLKGFPEAISSAFPRTETQLCIVHMIRNSLKYVGSKYQKEFIADLKTVYKAPSEDKASFELDKLIAKWGQKYPLAIQDVMKKWTMPLANWALTISQLVVMCEGRFDLTTI
jgi:transposase-like protein